MSSIRLLSGNNLKKKSLLRPHALYVVHSPLYGFAWLSAQGRTCAVHGRTATRPHFSRIIISITVRRWLQECSVLSI